MRCIVLVLILLSIPGRAFADESTSTREKTARRSAAALTSATPLRDAIADQKTRSASLTRARQPTGFKKSERADNWIRRHPACFGAIVGFMAGFAIGFLPGDDAVLDDFDASFNGLVIGGVGAVTGAVVGAVVVRD